MLEVDVEQRLGRFTLAARFRAGPGLTALFGRSGAGKTSLVNIIAGLSRPDRGHVAIDGSVLVDSATRIFVPKHRRRIGYVFQEGRLFPHLTVRQNLLFGRWFGPRTKEPSLDSVVELLGLGSLLERRPAALSGGEKQRVAIGRALLANPRLLLMDEPLASLDGPRKDEILPYIERLRDETRLPIVYVSHSVAEVTRLATTMVLMSDGSVDAVGTVPEVMGRLDLLPKTGRFEAGAVLETTVLRHEPGYGLSVLRCGEGTIRVPRFDLPEGAPVRIRIRARDVIVAVTRPVGLSALNVIAGTIVEIGPESGAARHVRIACGDAGLMARVTQRSVEALGLAPGLPVFAVVKSVALDRHSLGGAPPRDGEEFAEPVET